MDCQTPPMKLGATGVVETGAGIVLVSEAGCVRLAPHAVDPSAGVSSIHRVGTGSCVDDVFSFSSIDLICIFTSAQVLITT